MLGGARCAQQRSWTTSSWVSEGGAEGLVGSILSPRHLRSSVWGSAGCTMWNLGETTTMPTAGGLGSQRGRTIRGGHHPLAPRERAVKAKMRESRAPVESGRSDS